MAEIEPEEILAQARARIAGRRSSEWAAQQADERVWLLVLVGLVLAVAVVIMLLPGATLDRKLVFAARGLVAQQHNVFVDGLPIPICARNIGIYAGFTLALGSLLALGRGRAAALPPWPVIVVLLLGALSMVVDGFNSLFAAAGWPHLYPPFNLLRTITGLGAGYALAAGWLVLANRGLRADPDRTRAVLEWRELGVLLLAGAALLAGLYGRIPGFYWPLALLSFGGILFTLFGVFLLMAALALGYRRQVTHWRQLARPATLALAITIGYAVAFRLLRAWSEGGW